MVNLLSSLTTFIIHTISTLGYTGVALLMAIESAAIPLPSEIIAPFAGFLVASGRFSLWGVALAGGIGSMVGSMLTYWVGMYIGRPVIEKYGKYILISHHDLDIADNFFHKYGELATFIGRLLPVVRTFISIPAGIERVPFWKFSFFSFLGSVIWTYLLAFIGMKLGEHWDTLRNVFHKFDAVIVLFIVAAIAYWIYRHVRQNKKSANG